MRPETTLTAGIYAVDIFRDETCSDPRDDDGHFLWLGFPHRRYSIGDETIDPGEFSEECDACNGIGRDESKDIEPVYGETAENGWPTVISYGVNAPDCEKCEGRGEIFAHSLDELIEMVTRKYDALFVVPVGMIDHSGVSYYLGGGAHWCDPGGWDSGTCGLMLFTEQHIKDWGASFVDDEVRRQMAAELEEYTAWANGDCWGYVARLADDYEPTEADHDEWLAAVHEGAIEGFLDWCRTKYDPDDSCWGFVGMDVVEAEAKSTLNQLTKETITIS